MRHSRKSRRTFSLPDILPFIVGGAAIIVAVPLAILLSAASSRYAEAKKYEVTPTAAVSLEAEPREAPAPTPEDTPERRSPSHGMRRSSSQRRTLISSLASSITRRGASRSRDKPPSSRSSLTVASPTSSRIRSRRSSFRNTATFGSSPPLPTYTRRSRARHSITRSCTHTTPRSLSSRRRPCFSPQVHITSTLPLSSEIIIFVK